MTIKNVVCPGCSLLCDDIELASTDSGLKAKHACALGQTFFEQSVAMRPGHFVSGSPVERNIAVEAAVEALTKAQAPLICGLDHLTTQAQQIAWKIADLAGAAIDTTLTNAGRGSMFALQRVGKVTATLGEIASRSDLIVCWFCDPVTTHPRLLERLNANPDQPQRRIVVIGNAPNQTAELADEFIDVKPESAVALLATLRAILGGKRYEQDLASEMTGLELEQLSSLVETLTAARYGSIFYGQPNPDSVFDSVTETLHSFIRELNGVTRFVGIKLRGDLNAHSGENVLAWSSGFPFAINLQRPYPRSYWLESSAATILERGECDLILLATGWELPQIQATLSAQARHFFDTAKKIVLSPHSNFPAEVAFQIGIPGLNEAGEFCRTDDVSLPLSDVDSPSHRESLEPGHSAESILKALLNGLVNRSADNERLLNFVIGQGPGTTA